MIKKNIIEFRSAHPELDISHPIPSSRLVPEWYRKTEGAKLGMETVKKCIPFLDALTTGYMITTPADVWKRKGSNEFWSDSRLEIVSKHNKEQTDLFPNSEEYDPQPYKWINNWYIKTPKGYSCLFVHPLNDHESPFYSFTGVVDTDKHPVVINFPFLIRKDFDGKIPAGTPMIQIIPFKRTDWNMNVIDDQAPPVYKKEYEIMNPPFSWYKRNWWSKKIYS